MIIGITGGIGSGKSTVARIFKEFGYSLVDADQISRSSLDYGTKTYHQVVRRFGEEILFENGHINRSYLAEIVFSDREKLNDLNRITHNAVREQVLQEIEQLQNNGFSHIAYDCPLPVRNGFLDLVDFVTVVWAPLEKRISMIKKRNPSMDEEQIRERMKNQLSDEEYLSIADFKVENTGSAEQLRQEVIKLIMELDGLNRKIKKSKNERK